MSGCFLIQKNSRAGVLVGGSASLELRPSGGVPALQTAQESAASDALPAPYRPRVKFPGGIALPRSTTPPTFRVAPKRSPEYFTRLSPVDGNRPPSLTGWEPTASISPEPLNGGPLQPQKCKQIMDTADGPTASKRERRRLPPGQPRVW